MLQRLRRSIRRKRRATYSVTCGDGDCSHIACGISRDYENVVYGGEGEEERGEGGAAALPNVVVPNVRRDVRRRSRGGEFPTVLRSDFHSCCSFGHLLHSHE